MNMPAPAKATQILLFILLIALVPGCTGLKRYAYEGFNRDSWQKPDEVIRMLEIQHGESVADVGAGSGYFTFRLSEAVGATGKVLAVDIDEGMIEFLNERILQGGYSNVVTILAETGNPLLPVRGVDMIFLSNTYHHIEDREAYFKRAHRFLRKNGRIVIIDLTGKGWLERLSGHSIAKEAIIEEMEIAGYRLQNDHKILPRQSFLQFTPVGH